MISKDIMTVNKAVKSENEQLKERLLAVETRQEALEGMFLAMTTKLSKDKLAKLDNKTKVTK